MQRANLVLRALALSSLATFFACSSVLGLDDFCGDDWAGHPTCPATASTSTSGAGGGTGGGAACKPGEAVACYGGAPGTEGHGACKAGTKTCLSDGSAFGECTGEVTPKMADDCVNGVDLTCDGQLACACTPNSTMGCYDGPMGTGDVGMCKSGMHTCNADGTGYGACVGQVTPLPMDDCETTADENCDGIQNDGCGTVVWNAAFPASGNQGTVTVTAQTVTSTGDLVLVGTFRGTVDFGNGVSISSLAGDQGDIFLAKIDSVGKAVWAKAFSSASGTPMQYLRIASNDAGHLFIAGGLQGPIDFGGGVLTTNNPPNTFFASFDANGTHRWSRVLSSGGYATGIVCNSSGYPIVMGAFGTTLSLGPGQPNLTGKGLGDIFIGQLQEANGAAMWSASFGDSDGKPADSQTPIGMGIDAGNNIFLTGWFGTSIQIGTTATSIGGLDIFLAKLDPNGVPLWLDTFGSPLGESPSSVAIDTAGDPIITGVLQGTIDFGGGPLSGAEQETFLFKLNAAGNHLWSRRFAGAGYAVTTDANANVYFAGAAAGTVDFGNGPLTATGTLDATFAKFSPQGDSLWSRIFGTSIVPGNIYTSAQMPLSLNPKTAQPVLSLNTQATVDFGMGALSAGPDNSAIATATFTP